MRPTEKVYVGSNRSHGSFLNLGDRAAQEHKYSSAATGILINSVVMGPRLQKF